jgi:hypothetical protein
MKLNRLLLAAVLLAALAGLVYWANKKEEKDAKNKPVETTPKILTLSEDGMQEIDIQHREGDPTVLQKNAAGKWEITAPKPMAADQGAVASLTSAAASLNAERVIDEHIGDISPYGLAPALVEVTFHMKDGKITKLLVGNDTPTGNATYAKVDGDGRLCTMATLNKSNFDKSYKDLRDKRLMTFEQDKISRIELTAKKTTIEFGRVNSSEWQILKPRPMRADGLQVEELVRKVKDASMDTSVSEEDAKKAVTTFGSAEVVGIAKVTDASGTQTLEVRKSKDDYYAKSSVMEGVHKVTKDLATGLDKSLDDFRNKKLFDFGFSEPTRVEFKDGSTTAVYEKSGDKWMSAGKPMDSASIQALIDKLRDMAAAKFVETGFGAPQIELTVVSNDGKRTEKVQIAATQATKGGDAKFIAKRDGDASLYELDANAVSDLRQAVSAVKQQEAPPPSPDSKSPDSKKK